MGRRLLVLGLVPYVIWLALAYEYHFLDGVNLAFHEAGHLFLTPFGPTLHVLGGTLGQLFFPIACALHFLRRGQRFEAAVCGIWLAESAMYVARYLGDASAMALPLVGGHIHDWNWMLTRLGVLGWCEQIASALHVLASGAAIALLFVAGRLAFARDDAEGAALRDAVLSGSEKRAE